MLRRAENGGWRLVTHPDHAALAGDFAEAWGNDLFARPEPRVDVLEGIYCHDDGWRERDAAPQITRERRPSAFSTELVGKYSAFEEIDMADYLAVRGRALEIIASRNPYAAVIISMHTCDLLSARADRSTIKPVDLPVLDAFIADQRRIQDGLKKALAAGGKYRPEDLTEAAWLGHFRLLQACDNLSLLTCVDFPRPSTLLHRLATRGGGGQEVNVQQRAPGVFRLDPFPFRGERLTFEYPYRFVAGEFFETPADLQKAFAAAPVARGEVAFVRS
jgi:hypothetical protein